MGRFDGILLCTDLDGTLYRNDGTVSKENREAIDYFKREGGAFTFITGRMPYYAGGAYRAACPNVPFGCINGGGVYDGEAARYVWTCEMPKTVMDLVEYIEKKLPQLGIQVVCFERTYFAKENGTMENFRRITDLPNLVCHYRDVTEPVAKILFGSDYNEEILALEREIKSHPLAAQFDFIRSERTLFEILPKGIHKGVALAKLIEHMGVDPKRTIGIGDYDNDVGMFQTAGLGIAVSNASPAALAAADLVTVSNEEHAIARVICDLERGVYAV